MMVRPKKAVDPMQATSHGGVVIVHGCLLAATGASRQDNPLTRQALPHRAHIARFVPGLGG